MLQVALRPWLRVIACGASALFVAGFSGCAAVKAARQPDKKNLGVLHEGTPRAQVIAELGAPTYTKPKPDGTVEDVFAFKQGYSKGVKMTRAFGHAAADVATGGLWEVVGIPAEIWADGTDVQVLVTYDQEERVKYRRIFKGQEVFAGGKGRQSLAGRRAKATKVAAKPSGADAGDAADRSSKEGDQMAADAPPTDSGPTDENPRNKGGGGEAIFNEGDYPDHATPASATSE